MEVDPDLEHGEPFIRGADRFGPEFTNFDDATALVLWMQNHAQQALSDCGWPRDAGGPHTASRATPERGALA